MPESLRVRVHNLTVNLGQYVQAFAEAPPFTDEQLAAHVDTMAVRARLGSTSSAANSREFADSLRHTLKVWRMDQYRGAKLVPPDAFHASLRRCAADIVALESLNLEDPSLNVATTAERLWRLIDRLRITETAARLVTSTKALHHLLPSLVVPMDRQFTGAFFEWNDQAWQGKQERSFRTAFPVFAAIARTAKPSRFVGSKWNTSASKVLDNALIGYCRKQLLDRPSYEKALIAQAKELGIYDEIVTDVKKRLG